MLVAHERVVLKECVIYGSLLKQKSPMCEGGLVRNFPFHSIKHLIFSATNGHFLTVCGY